jgi:hypothetical protein
MSANDRVTLPSIAQTASAERMRRSRQRRRAGLRVVSLELHETEVDALIARKLLPPDARNDANAIAVALYEFYYRTLSARC